MTVVGRLLIIGSLLLGQTDGTVDEDLRLEVGRLVRSLNAQALAEREAAEQSLIELGPDVLDLLPGDEDHVPAEVALRVGRVRQRLQRALAESVVRPSTVTLPAGKVPLSEILATIEEQTGNKIVDYRPRLGGPVDDPELHVGAGQGPFWQVFDRVLDQARLDVYPYGEETAIHVVARPAARTARADRASYSGPLRFEAVSIWAQRDLRDPLARSLQLKMEIAWEPRLAPVNLQLRMADVEAIDDRGKPLEIDGRQTELEVPVDPISTAKELIVPLVPPSRNVKKIARLGGTLTAMVPGKAQTFRFQEIEDVRGVQQRAAGVTVTLEQVRKNNTLWEVRMCAGFDAAGGALQSHRTWVYNNEAYLEDPDGKPIPHNSYNTTRQTENEVGIAYLFAIDGPLTGYSFVYKTPGQILSTRFDFEIKDVDLP